MNPSGSITAPTDLGVVALLRTMLPVIGLCSVVALPWALNPLFLDDWHLLYRAQQAPWTWEGLTRAFTFLDGSSIASWNLPDAAPYHYFRPLVVASFKLDLLLWGTSPLGSHLVNLLLHLGSVLLVGWLALWLSKDRLTARIAAAVFGLQPMVAVAVVWTSGRTELMVAFFTLAALVAYAVARQTRRPWLLSLTLLFQSLAILSKESAVILPLCIAAVEIAAWRGVVRLERWRAAEALAYVAGPCALAALQVALRFTLFDSGAALGAPYFHPPWDAGFLSFVLVKIPYYLFSWLSTVFLVPLFGVEFLQRNPIALALLLMITAAALYGLTRGRWQRATTWIGAAWLAVSLLPTLPLMSNELYLYFGSAGFGLLVAGWLADQARSPRRWHRAIVVAWAAVYCLGFLGRGAFYRLQGQVSERVYADITRDAPVDGGTRLLLVNMPLAASHVASTARLATGHRDVESLLLTISPEWSLPTERPRVTCLGPDRLRIEPPASRSAFFSTPEEWHLQQLHVPVDPEGRYAARGVTVEPVERDGAIAALDVTLPSSLDRGNQRVYAFYDDGRKLAHRVCAAPSGPEAKR